MIINGYEKFIENCLNKINEYGIDITKMNLDHFGYQTSSVDEYEKLIKEIDNLGVLIHEEEVNGRRVGIIEFKKPLKFKDIYISAMELVEPKKDQVCKSALEHIELVANESLESIVKKNPDLNWDLSKIEQGHFPMITLKLWDGAQVKFHKQHILKIANELNKQKVI